MSPYSSNNTGNDVHRSNESINHDVETEEEDESIHTIVKWSNDVHDVLHEN